MKLYKFIPSNEDQIVSTKTKDDALMIINDLGKGNFRDLKNNLIELEGNAGVNDILWLHPEGILCRERAYQLLRPLLLDSGKWNKMQLGEEVVYYFSVLSELDVLNSQESKFVEFDGVLLGVEKYVLKDEQVDEQPIFRIASVKGHYPVVNHKFVEFIHVNGITGLDFEELPS